MRISKYCLFLSKAGVLTSLLNGMFLPSVYADESPSSVKEIIVICKTHFDIGYTHRVNEIVNYYQTDMIDKAFTLMDTSADLPKEQQFAWTLPGWVLHKIMADWDGQSVERKQNLEEKFKSGKIISHALPFTLISDICGVEEMTRGLEFSSALNKKHQLPLSRSGKMTDEPSHAGAMATVLANAGIKFLHIGCNWPSGFVKTPGLFWWEGPDGSRILTLYSAIYGTCYGVYPKGWTSPNDPMVGENLIPAKDWPYKVWPAILVTGDNSGPPTGDQIKAIFDEIKVKMPDAKVRMGTMDDFYDAIMKENPVLPVVKNAMPDTWIHGVMCDPEGMRLLRETRPLLASAEVLDTQLKNKGIHTSSIASSVATAYENVLLYDEHTWGGSARVNEYGEAFKQLPTDKYANLEASWKDKNGYIREASQIAHSLTEENLICLAEQVKQTEPSFIVYNPLPWECSGWVEIEGKTMFAKNIPPCGYRSFSMNKLQDIAQLQQVSHTIENDFFKIVLDPTKGTISSLVDKKNNREWVDNHSEQGLGQYLNERFTFEQTLDYTMAYQQGRANSWPHPGMHKPGMVSEKEVPYRATSPINGELKICRNRQKQTAELSMPTDTSAHLPASILRVSLYDDMPYIDLEITLQNKAKDNWPEADWLCLPFKIENPEFNVYRQLGIMNPAKDIQPGANRHLYAVGNGVTITEKDGTGVAICPLDHPLVSLDTPGCWKYSENFVPQKSMVYLNLYNNQWNTNFRYWYPGTWSSRVRLWTIEKGTTANERSQLFTAQVLETQNPLQTVVGKSSSAGTLPSQLSGLKVSRKGVMITAFSPNVDKDKGTLLRVWEQAGTSGKLILTLPKEMKVSHAQPINLRGEQEGVPIPVKSGKFEFELNGYAPASFLLN